MKSQRRNVVGTKCLKPLIKKNAQVILYVAVVLWNTWIHWNYEIWFFSACNCEIKNYSMIYTVCDLVWHQSLSSWSLCPFLNNLSCHEVSMNPFLKKHDPEVCAAFSGADLCPREAEAVSNYNCQLFIFLYVVISDSVELGWGLNMSVWLWVWLVLVTVEDTHVAVNVVCGEIRRCL